MFITIEQQLQVYRLYRLHIICAHIMSQTNGLKMCVIGIIKLFTWCSVGWSSNLISYSIHIVYIPLPFGIYQHNVRGHSNYLQKFSTRIDDYIYCVRESKRVAAITHHYDCIILIRIIWRIVVNMLFALTRCEVKTRVQTDRRLTVNYTRCPADIVPIINILWHTRLTNYY